MDKQELGDTGGNTFHNRERCKQSELGSNETHTHTHTHTLLLSSEEYCIVKTRIGCYKNRAIKEQESLEVKNM